MKMNYLYLSAGTALVLCSCSNEVELVNELPQESTARKEIVINGTYSAGLTRANVTEAEMKTLIMNGFNLSAMSQGEYIIDSKYEYSGETWKPESYEDEEGAIVTPTFYWPTNEGQKVEFYGIYCADNREAVSLNDSIATVYTLDGQTDVMTAYQVASYRTSDAGAIMLEFGHIMSKVEAFVTVPEVEGYQYMLTSVMLTVPHRNDYTISTGSWDTASDTTVVNLIDEQMEVAGEENTIGSAFVVPTTEAAVTVYYQYRFLEQVSGETVTETGVLRKEEISLVQGKRNVLGIEIPAPGQKEITVQADVVDWGE